ncbi:uncharacterized protein MELLADRAFT_104395 [Melampsora larici-populina 98AG31]|uniref:Uncharacterized protein n=1 Tax=Melampsora larici-populina (strain 98AG31 / pathotype 3-4-7) TaxID=747676 RepID=F4REJ3_MELLP|nr:uncharacterized protein MELLADRAFT_104395 [Melampsora larici-populina 98AG31]EGG09104.1 hypothetical protein MELLADRAFT_104395 [Melampsora larici-populina 98AG31]
MAVRVGRTRWAPQYGTCVLNAVECQIFHSNAPSCFTQICLPWMERSTSNSENNKEIPARPLYNLLPQSFPNDVTNRSLYAGRSTKPIPIHLAQPERWQRGAQFLGVTLSLGIGVWGVLFADFGNNDRETVFSPASQPYGSSTRKFDPYLQDSIDGVVDKVL